MNPYLQRVVARMEADNALQKLNSHWSARAQRLVDRPGYLLDQAGFERLAARYCNLTTPVVNWLTHRQWVFLRRYF